MNTADIKPDDPITVIARYATGEIFTELLVDPDPGRLDSPEMGDTVEDIVSHACRESFALGVESVEIPPTLDAADMEWLIAQAMVAWDGRWFPLSRYLAAVSRDIKTIAESRWQEPVPGACLHEARRLIRLVETLGIDWPTDADLETAPEGGEA